MIILNTVLAIFIVLELFNLLALYLNPSMKQMNAVGVFNVWEKSKKDSETHSLISYLVYWVAGTKLIIVSLLTVVLLLADPTLKIIAVGVLALTITSFYWKMYPIVKNLDRDNHLAPRGYHKTLSIIIAVITIALSLSALFAYISLG
ncbi:MAG TPA: hypothetical protein PJ993_02450 [Candidatus Saccharibacteria bacterium]|nr:hypothetical protein [Candidatus Saccharibacteria bacterium]HMT39765.1 hypothetical protein [Candidatus Saccharibacteria bacterium]